MKSYNFKVENKSVQETIDFSLFKKEENILIQVFCGQTEESYKKAIDSLLENLPQAICIGSTSDGEIFNNEVNINTIVITISVFEQTFIKSSYSTKEACFDKGVEIATNLITSNTKLLILFTNAFNTNADNFLKGIESVNKEVIVCGGIAANDGSYENTFISSQNKILKSGAIGVSLNSDILSVQNDYRFNWSSIGIEHNITKAEENRIYEINGLNTADFYKKYLGEDIIDSLPQGATSFPLLVKRNRELTARAMMKIHDDGSFQYTGNFQVGDKVKFGFGNAEMILKHPIIPESKDYTNSESFFIYSCMARRRYVPDLIHTENAAYSTIANTSGFFTDGEFFNRNKKNELLNQTFTVVALTENQSVKNNVTNLDFKKKDNSNEYAKTIKTLSRLIEESSKDYNEQSKNLENEKINSQLLLTAQKIFLRHAVHETNTPISVIMSNIELYEMEHGKNQYLSTIEVALKNIFNIYDDLSYLVKKDQVVYPKKPIDLVDFIRSRIEFFNQSANQIGSQFIFNSDTSSLNIKFNETKLQRIVDNNLTNAIKYTEENSNIYITLRREHDQYVLIISSCSQYIQYPEKIFKEYYREESTKQGFGLGLSLVKRICDEENIGIAIESNEYFTSFRYIFNMENL